MVRTAALPDWAQCIEQELVGNILPFWMRHTVDEVNGGFYGAVTPDLRILNHVPRSAVLYARMQGELEMLAQVRATAVRLAEAVYAEGLDADGSVLYEAEGPASADKHWWVQAEAVVGFYNAYQLSSQEHFAHAARRCWSYIEDKLVDRTHGDWFKRLSRAGIPYADHFKVGPWECPYHHSRACFEMMARLSSRDS
jgi:mannose/cellobiose epimerase-like protein (N-acyl-D-glucosamine 2-epimerase family)